MGDADAETITRMVCLALVGLALTAGFFGNLAVYQQNRHDDVQACIRKARDAHDARECYTGDRR